MTEPEPAADAAEPADVTTDDDVQVPQWKSLDEIHAFTQKAGLGRFTEDAMRQLKRPKLQDPKQPTNEGTVNAKVEDDNGTPTPQTPPKTPRPPTTLPPTIARQ